MSEDVSGQISGDIISEDDQSSQVLPENTGSGLPKQELNDLTDEIITALKSVYDPEIPVDIYELGLIYRVDVSDDKDIDVDMTLTAPGCPVALEMPEWVGDALRAIEGIGDVKVNMVFDPTWGPEKMSDEARVALNMF